MSNVSSPCIKICVVDPARRLCLGCGRTLDEIGGWSSMDEADRLAVMAALPERLRSGPDEVAGDPARAIV